MNTTDPATSEGSIVDVAIVGAGMAGCSAARQLMAAGQRVLLVDRGRQIGGRACSNRAGFDYGVPAFHADDPGFIDRVRQWQQAGLVSLWQPRARQWLANQATVEDLPTIERPHEWVATDTLAGVLNAEVAGADCRHHTAIQTIAYQDGIWTLSDTLGNRVGRARELLLAMPLEQARRLLPTAIEKSLLPLERPTMPMSVPQWVAMLEFEAAVSPSTDLILFDEHPVLAAAWSEARKPAGSETNWIVHSQPAWAQTRLNTERETIAEQLFASFKQAIGRCPLIMSHRAHRWTFSRARAASGKGPLRNQHPPVTLLGDWSVDGSLQGAWLSGRAAADELRGAQ